MVTNKIPFISSDELARTSQQPTRVHPDKIDVSGLQRELERNIEGEVRFDFGSKAMYAVDASNYRQVPIGIVIPRSKEDVVQAVAACRRFGAPLLSRGGGTSLAGQCCNVAIVIDWSKYMHGVLEIDTSQRWARVLPGTVCDELRSQVMKQTQNRLVWGPDPATHNHCCLGGMIGNNSCGAHAQMSGKTDNNIEELEVLLYDGTRMSVGWMDEAELSRKMDENGRRGEIFSQLKSLRDRYAGLNREKYPPIPRRVSGYNLDQLLPGQDGRFNVARALVGSEGTLVTILEAKCRLIDAKSERVVLMLGYPDIYEGADQVPAITKFEPTALEGFDHRLHELIEKKGGTHKRYLKMFPEGNGWLMAEFGADTKDAAIQLAHEAMASLEKMPRAPKMKLMTEALDMERVWEVRESGLGATAFVPGERDTWPGWEDSAVAPEQLGGYLREIRALYSKYDYNPALYGHFGQGCVHCRVDFDLVSAEGIRKWRSFLDEAADLCVKYGGSLSGEHGDGQARAELLEKMFGAELIEAFRSFKSIWDPDWMMNPGKIVNPNAITADLRLGATYDPWEPTTHFKFPDDKGSFSRATLRCVGVGKCRRKQAERTGDETMCPSFMATHEERHTTRGRAHNLWEMLNGEVIANGWRDDNVKEALDLCLSCKGCKTDCPVNVDMATYKAEFLSHYWEGRIRPRHAYAFGLIDQWSRLVSLLPGAVNLVTQTPGVNRVAKFLAGMSPERQIPEFAPITFQKWFRTRTASHAGNKGKVVLWPDTFNNYFFPETAQAAVEVLENAGYQVQVPRQHLCCGRPLYDYGMLGQAKRYLQRVMQNLSTQLEEGFSVVVLEPSCASVFRDESHGLFPEDPLAHKLRNQTFLFSEFLEREGVALPKIERKAIVHGHCHHKTVLKFDDERSVLQKLGLDATVLASGCCGMAGSFGFERGKHELSVAIGERSLLPEVRNAATSTLVIADGFSCREQISQQTGRQALHIAEVIRSAETEQNALPAEYPESAIGNRRKRTRRQARSRALFAVGVIAVTAATFGMFFRRSSYFK